MSTTQKHAIHVLSSLPHNKENFEKRLKTSRLAMQRINPNLLLNEPSLMVSTYADYRFMTPDERTELFRQTYARHYSQAYRQYINYVDSDKMTGLVRSTTKYMKPGKSGLIDDAREYSSLWSQRQFADQLGFPYQYYIIYAIESHMNRKRKKLPRPNQLVTGAGKEIVLKYVIDKCNDRLGSMRNVSFLGQYRNQYFIGLPPQIQHREDCVNALGSSGSICTMIGNDLLPDEAISKKYNDDVLERMKADAQSNPLYFKKFTPLAKDDLLPGCFFMPLAYNSTSDICSECVYSQKCNPAQEKYLAARKSEDLPINDYIAHRRKTDRLRQQRNRAKRSNSSP